MNSAWNDFRQEASKTPQKIAFADGEDPRAIQAAIQLQATHTVHPILLGSESRINSQWKHYGGQDRAPVIDFESLSPSEQVQLTQQLLSLPKFKTLTEEEAKKKLSDTLFLGSLLVRNGKADGFVGGASRTTGDTLRAVFSVIGLAPRTTALFGFFLIEPAQGGRPILLADCAVIPEPTPKQLAHIAIGSAAAYEFFIKQPAYVAFLSFSTAGSAEHEKVSQVRTALAMAREKAPSLKMEGEWQADAALDAATAQCKGVGDSSLAGKANVLVVPDLNCGNIAYKLVQRLGNCRAVGPILWGLGLPANDLSRGCSVEDIIDMAALTALQKIRGYSGKLTLSKNSGDNV